MKRKNNVSKIGKGGDGKEFAPVKKMPRPKNYKFWPHECSGRQGPHETVEQDNANNRILCVDCGVEVDCNHDPIGPGTSEEPPMPEQKPVMISHGEYLVGTYESGGNPEVEWYRKRSAEIIDRLTAIMDTGDDGAGRCAAVSLSKYEEACMWAVKAVTKPPAPV